MARCREGSEAECSRPLDLARSRSMLLGTPQGVGCAQNRSPRRFTAPYSRTFGLGFLAARRLRTFTARRQWVACGGAGSRGGARRCSSRLSCGFSSVSAVSARAYADFTASSPSRSAHAENHVMATAGTEHVAATNFLYVAALFAPMLVAPARVTLRGCSRLAWLAEGCARYLGPGSHFC